MLIGVGASAVRPEYRGCLEQLNRIHTVTTDRGRFLLYGDPRLAGYLQGEIGDPAGVSVVPVFTDDRVAIRQESRWIVSTGLFLSSHSVDELRAVVQGAPLERTNRRRHGRRRPGPAVVCTGLLGLGSFTDHQVRVAADIRRYAEWMEPHFSTRPDGAGSDR